MKKIRTLALLTISLPCALMLSVPAQAAFMSDYEGYSVFGEPCGLCDSTVSFAVWENTSTNWIGDLGLPTDTVTDLEGFTSTGREKYVYLYQIVNTNPKGSTTDGVLGNFNVSYGPRGANTNPSPFRSAGYFFEHSFTNVSEVGIPPVDDPNDGSPSALTSMGGFTRDDSVINPAGLSFEYITASPAVTGIFPAAAFQWDFDNKLGPDDMSAVLYLTSDRKPMFRWGETESVGGLSAAGDVPSVVPLPTSVWLFGASLVAVISLARRKPA